jgi:DNA-binding transcriptional ArsR family regulator
MSFDASRAASLAPTPGDADLAALGAVLAEPARARILLALGDGRALAASVLATEAGVAPSTASTHLARLLDAGLVTVRPQGRHRYYALAGPHVGELIEVLARLAPCAPVRSLRDGTHAHARRDRLSGPGRDLHYRLTRAGRRCLSQLGVRLPAPDPAGDVALRYCVDWTEQAHHLSGAVGRALTHRLFELGWLERIARTRGVRLTEDGERGLREHLGLHTPAPDRG